ncbi:MAG: divalent-cation tolerance protein CutA [Candidatus Bathyarchaeota archaeon]|nr:MAG: divalent-cation tolerance protein CutA [Candidatus Bathyarchaeota archaeon]
MPKAFNRHSPGHLKPSGLQKLNSTQTPQTRINEGLIVTDYVQIITAAGSKEDAEKIANALLHDRCAACVQIIGPVTSVYWWNEKVETALEWLCLVKTRRDLYEAVASTVHKHHTYKVPEILAVSVVEGDEAYFAWLDGELRK